MKKQIAITTAAAFLVLSMTGFAQAGSRHGHHHNKHHKSHHSHHHHHHHHNHALEGVVIGAGALMLGAAIAQSINTPSVPAAPSIHMVPPPPAPCVRNQGHWETRRVWVPPVYETRWNPAHYDAAGYWVQGRYENFMTSNGYWEQSRVWVNYASVY